METYVVHISKLGLVRERSLVLEKGERVFFDGPKVFEINFLHTNPFGPNEINQSRPLTEGFTYDKKAFKDYWNDPKRQNEGFPYCVRVGNKQTDPPVLKPPGSITPQRSGGQKPPGPIILPPPTCPGHN